VVGHGPGDDIAYRVQVCTAVVVDDPFGIARRTRGVVQRNRVPFVGGGPPSEGWIASRDKCFVTDRADGCAWPGEFRIVDVDHEQVELRERECFLDGGGELTVYDDHLRAAVPEHEADRLGVQARVQRIENGARHWDPEVALDHFGSVRKHHGDGVSGSDAPSRQSRRKPSAARIGLGPGEAPPAVNYGQALRIHVGGTLDEAERGQGRVVGRILAEVDLVGI
jgi:hypothetical protein